MTDGRAAALSRQARYDALLEGLFSEFVLIARADELSYNLTIREVDDTFGPDISKRYAEWLEDEWEPTDRELQR